MQRPQAPRRDERARFGAPRPRESTGKAPSMSAQSLLFKRDQGWNESKAKAWAKAHGYRYGSVDVTDQYVRIRQFDPKGIKVARTIPFGRGIRAVVAREGVNSMATTREAHRRPRRATKKKAKSTTARKRPTHRRTREVAEASRPRRRRAKKAVARKAPRRRRARVSSHVMEAKRRAPRRRRHKKVEAWKGNVRGHAKAAKKGWRRKKARRAAAAPKRRRAKRARETMYAAAPKRRRTRRHHRAHAPNVMEAKRSRRRYHAHAKSKSSSGMTAGELALAVFAGGVGFVIADGLDRLLATYNPSSTDAPPTDKFTSNGAGTLANTLNVAATPNWKRLAAGIGITALPAVGSMYVDNPMVKSSLEGMAIGAGVSVFKTLWNNVLMPLLAPKDTSPASLQKSYIARLYPAEVAAHINMAQTPPLQAVSSAGSGALSGPPAQYAQPGVAAPAAVGVAAPADVGPFALADQTGMSGSASGNALPTLQNTWGTGASAVPASTLPTVNQAMHGMTHGSAVPGGTLPTAAQVVMGTAGGYPGQPGMGFNPGPPDGPGPGPQAAPHTESACGCMGDGDQFLGFIGDAPASDDAGMFLTP